MFDGQITILQIVLGAAAFMLILSLWIGGIMIWNARRQMRARKIERRMGFESDEEGAGRVLTLWLDDREKSVVVRDTAQPSLVQRMRYQLHQAGWEVPLKTVVLGLVGGGLLLGAMMYAVTGNLVLAIASAFALAVLFKIYLNQCVSRRSAQFERQFVDSMELAARSLRAGHPLMGAFALVAEEMAKPVSDVFADVCQNHELGLSVEDALQRAAANSRTSEMKLFTTSVCIQMRSGGNLADMMERLAYVVRDRMRLSRRVRILTAQTQLSKRILIALPILLFLLLNVIAPEYMSTFFTELAGQIMLGVAVAGLLFGAWAMNRLAVMRY